MSWEIDRQEILSIEEVNAVLAELQRRAKRAENSQMLLALFHLTTILGLRASEVVQLRLDDLRVDNGRPHVRVRAGATKRTRKRKGTTKRKGVGRTVPIWLSSTGTDLAAWKAKRIADGATPTDPVVVSLRKGTVLVDPRNPNAGTTATYGKPLTRQSINMKFKTALRGALGKERASSLHVHCGRHTCASLWLRKGKSPPQVRDALGHSSLAVTNIYASIISEDDTPIDTL